MLFKLSLIIIILFWAPQIPCYSQAVAGEIPIPHGMNKTILSKRAIPTGKQKFLPLKEIQEINHLKSGYDSISSQIRELKNSSQDSATNDSLFVELKVKSMDLIDREMSVLEELKQSNFSSSSDIGGAISYTQRNLAASKEMLGKAKDLDSLGDILNTNEENLKALVNEYVFPGMDKMTTGMPLLPSAGKPQFTDYYSKGGLEALSQGADLGSVKASLENRAKTITPEMLGSYGKDFSKIELLEDGSVKVTPKITEAKTPSFFEPNNLKGARIIDRLGAGFTYNAVEAFTDGINANLYASYAFSQQLELQGGVNVKRHFGRLNLVTREGQGIHSSLRFIKNQWFVQGTVEWNSISVTYEKTNLNRDFEGRILNGLISLGRKVEITKKINGIFVGLFDPTFTDNKRLHSSQFMLRMGFEVKSR